MGKSFMAVKKKDFRRFELSLPRIVLLIKGFFLVSYLRIKNRLIP